MNRTRSWQLLLFPVLLLAYSLSVHLGIWSGQRLPALLLLLGMIALSTSRGIRRGSLVAVGVLAVALVAAAGLWSSDRISSLFYLPPILMNLLLAVLFGGTLLPGNTPLVTQFSIAIKGEIDAKAVRYTRRVTWAWLIFSLCLASEALLLAIYASPRLWSLFTNLINYLLLVAFFFIEYRIRIRVFSELEHPGFIGFLAQLARLDPRRFKVF